ncbi:hypothetical protein [Dielma fastidiosa]|uniref:hypothetical protein n=1 Tax=Dielma fastidiosa TaxID=1034346 RepID=UPI0015FC4ACB|nr:hypothetical protein [Dielma fastidiosa]
MEITEITVFRKFDKKLVVKVFKDREDIKQIVSDEYEVIVETKDPQYCEPNV